MAVKALQGDVPDEFRCAATGRPLYYPVVTDQGVAYCYSALLEMFLKAEGIPRCVVTDQPIVFFPNVCAALHHFMIDQYSKDLKGRKKIEEDLLETYGLKVPLVSDAPDEDGDEGFLEEFQCPVSRELAYEPCCLSSGTIVSARSIPAGGFKKDPNRLVACGLHDQAPRPSKTLASMIRTKFPNEYRARETAAATSGNSVSQATCKEFGANEHIHIGLGCDGCGLWPIRGKAFEDVECRSKVGFHLCQACYDLGYHKRVMGGRFSQGHLPKNTMALVTECGLF
eukprot:TRINITY_DN81261_c0_g1_i1.p1 TRINITY_DN81261_c0_g1~~TRINITY_DN81261_c0_g1_i1.p1  ORF type:complete len:299 (+),score=44.13 TRINITY_DN81261_c0_g1_i1:49-897(+)